MVYHGNWEEYLTAANGVERSNEGCIVGLSDGTFLINSRNDSDEKYRAVAFSSTGYSHWSEYQFDRQLNDQYVLEVYVDMMINLYYL